VVQGQATEIIVLVTAPSSNEADLLGRKIIELRLAACVNLIPGVRSLFRWDGKVTEETECLMIFKSTKDCYADLERMIRQEHSYSVPEVIALPIIDGSASYLQWIRSETQK
jgi:periplasmic divalent cation tolerance protein